MPRSGERSAPGVNWKRFSRVGRVTTARRGAAMTRQLRAWPVDKAMENIAVSWPLRGTSAELRGERVRSQTTMHFATTVSRCATRPWPGYRTAPHTTSTLTSDALRYSLSLAELGQGWSLPAPQTVRGLCRHADERVARLHVAARADQPQALAPARPTRAGSIAGGVSRAASGRELSAGGSGLRGSSVQYAHQHRL